MGTELVAEVAVHRQRPVRVGGVDGALDIELDVGLLEQPESLNDLVEGGVAAFVDPVAVAQGRRSADADAHEEPVLGQQLVPLPGQECAVGPEGVAHLLTRQAMPVRTGHHRPGRTIPGRRTRP